MYLTYWDQKNNHSAVEDSWICNIFTASREREELVEKGQAFMALPDCRYFGVGFNHILANSGSTIKAVLELLHRLLWPEKWWENAVESMWQCLMQCHLAFLQINQDECSENRLSGSDFSVQNLSGELFHHRGAMCFRILGWKLLQKTWALLIQFSPKISPSSLWFNWFFSSRLTRFSLWLDTMWKVPWVISTWLHNSSWQQWQNCS